MSKEDITNVKGYLVLADLEYIKYAENSIPIDIPTHDICEENFGTNDQGEDTYLCACGKPHIKKLSIVKYDNPKLDFKYIILGTECIKTTIEFLHKTGEIHHLKTKMMCWYGRIIEEGRKYKNNACFSCEEYNIPKKTDYKKEFKKYYLHRRRRSASHYLNNSVLFRFAFFSNWNISFSISFSVLFS